MLRVTWEWLGQGPALDLADTVAIVDGVEHDLIESDPDYERWARTEAAFLPPDSIRLLVRARPELLRLRTSIRELLGAVAEGEAANRAVADELNRASRRAPGWLELDPTARPAVRERSSGAATDDIVARYARSAMMIAADEAGRLRRCPAPSCGMFYLRGRDAQRWCSTQCGTRARVARHYGRRREPVGPP